jgi:hypothetical protein
VGGQLHAPGVFTSGEIAPIIYRARGGMGSRADLGAVKNKKICKNLRFHSGGYEDIFLGYNVVQPVEIQPPLA